MTQRPDRLWEHRQVPFRPTRIDLGTKTCFDQYTERSFQPGDIAEQYHEASKLHERTAAPVARSMHEFESPRMQYLLSTLSPDYPGSDSIELPTDIEVDEELATLLSDRRSIRSFAPEPMTRADLSRLLRVSCGPTAKTPVEHLGIETSKRYRAYPSAGALYPIEIYPLVLEMEDLETGVYYYTVEQGRLRHLADAAPTDDITTTFLDPISEWNTSVVLALTGAFWRSKMKYGPRAYRYVLQESGHLAQNVQLVAGATGLGSVPLASFYDDRLNDLLDLDGVNEAVVYAIAVGRRESGRA